jgi:hypothetical protein
MAIPSVLRDLHNASDNMYAAIYRDYEFLQTPEYVPRSQVESSRNQLTNIFIRLEDLCYEDYFKNGGDTAVVPQDVWIPSLTTFRNVINIFDDSESLHRAADIWEHHFQAYRRWVSGSDIHQSDISDMWYEVVFF